MRADPRLRRAEPSPTASLVIRAKAGDEHAFEAIMERCQGAVLRTAFALLGNFEDAEDAAQEVFLRFFRHLRRVDETRDPAPWFYRITVNVCRDIAKRRKRAAWWALAGWRESRVEPAPRPVRRAEMDEQRRVLKDGLNTLSKRERAAIVLRDIEGLSTKEVAGALGSSETTVRSQVSRARVKLKRYRDRVLKEER